MSFFSFLVLGLANIIFKKTNQYIWFIPPPTKHLLLKYISSDKRNKLHIVNVWYWKFNYENRKNLIYRYNSVGFRMSRMRSTIILNFGKSYSILKKINLPSPPPSGVRFEREKREKVAAGGRWGQINYLGNLYRVNSFKSKNLT